MVQRVHTSAFSKYNIVYYYFKTISVERGHTLLHVEKRSLIRTASFFREAFFD